ncbi:MAG: PH domain-containing protein [Bdellovibrionales bacterium]
MLYVQQSLGPDEELIYVGHFHWMYTVNAFMSIFFGMVISVMVIVGGIMMQKFMGNFPQELPVNVAIPALPVYVKGGAFLMFVMGVYAFAIKMVHKATTEIAITDTRLIYKTGVVARNVGEMSIDRIEGVNVLQSVLGRIFNYGRLAIRGMGIGEVILPPIEDPIAFRQAIERARSV